MKGPFKFILTLALLVSGLSLQAQQARLFLDIPGIYLHTSNISELTQNAGLGADAGFGIGTHNFMGRFQGGTTVTADFDSEAIEETIDFQPFVRLEVGAGLWRTNGNKCAAHNSNAFTAMAKGGMQYLFSLDEDNLQYTVGIELSYFRIRDYKNNMELFLEGGLNTTTEKLYANFGFRHFINLRAY
ncbi:MAG: hypothetical protein K9I85_07290 [Saprospiraceae bacterium]|nr:hypothetical protein [Saprospiraceae bacterium]